MSNGYGRSTDGFGISRQQSVELIVKTALENGVNDPRQIAYMLATAQHETRNFTAPDEDFGRNQAAKLGYRGGTNYFGRGYVHLTHDENYEKFDKLLGLNGELVKNPQLAKDPEIAAKILVLGMRDGLFTGRALDRYIDHDSHDLYNARRTVNGIRLNLAWSVKAAKLTQGYAEVWEISVPDLIEKVQRGGVDVSQRELGSRTPSTGDVSSPGRLFRQGSEGAQVRELQAGLAALGYLGRDDAPLIPDGHFGPNTTHAVKAFQRAHGLDDDGIVGAKTTNTMEQARTHSPRELQATLAALGYPGGDAKPLIVDGYVGSNTTHAVKAFQRAHGLNEDGMVGPKTMQALEHARIHPLISEKTHPSNTLYRAIAEDFPAGTKASVIANVTMQAMENGINDPSKLRDVVSLKNGDVMVRGNAIGTQVQVDLQAPTSGIQQMSDHVAREAREQQQLQEQQQQQQQQRQQQQQQQNIQQTQTRFA